MNSRDTEEGREAAAVVEPAEMAASAVDGAAAAALRSVLRRVHQAAERSGRRPEQIRVVAVSKVKPPSLVQQVYNAGHRRFGENYVQEIVDKAPQLPEDIEWHFIGNLQSNKVKPLLTGVPNLAMVETVDDEKIANHLDRAVGNIGRKPLKVFVQVNTSGETSKFGVDPAGCVELVKHVSSGCPNLEFCGLMTIGMPDYTSTPENFKTLANCRTEVCKALGIAEEQCDLSMGMSGDFELATQSTSITEGSLQRIMTVHLKKLDGQIALFSSTCVSRCLVTQCTCLPFLRRLSDTYSSGKQVEMGSTNVRIGSTIFGAR